VSLGLDASLVQSWYFEDERTLAVDAVLEQVVASGALVQPLWRIAVTTGIKRRSAVSASTPQLEVEKQEKSLNVVHVLF